MYAIPAAIGVSLSTGAQSAKAQSVQGVINGGATMTLQTADAPRLSVLLTPATEVDQVEGVLKARKKQMTSLILGLPVQVPGSMNDQGQLVATSVKFKGDDLKAAMDAQAGLRQTIAARSVPAGESAQKRHRDFEACSVFVLGRGE